MASLLSSATTLSPHPLPRAAPFTCKTVRNRTTLVAFPCIRAAASAEPPKEKVVEAAKAEEVAAPKAKPPPKRPVYSMKKGQIVRVDKEKYLNSIHYLSVGHPLNYKGLDYIYEDRGEVLDIRIFDTGEHALIAWVGIPTAPAWLPTDMLIKSDRLDYERV